jgi:hypothetical protein
LRSAQVRLEQNLVSYPTPSYTYLKLELIAT